MVKEKICFALVRPPRRPPPVTFLWSLIDRITSFNHCFIHEKLKAAFTRPSSQDLSHESFCGSWGARPWVVPQTPRSTEVTGPRRKREMRSSSSLTTVCRQSHPLRGLEKAAGSSIVVSPGAWGPRCQRCVLNIPSPHPVHRATHGHLCENAGQGCQASPEAQAEWASGLLLYVWRKKGRRH